MAQYSIGEQEFIAIHGAWSPPAEAISVDQRPGVDGSEITAHGKKGRPFVLTTFVDQVTYPIALGTIHNYQLYIDNPPVPLVLHGRSSETVGVNGFLVQVLDVEMQDCFTLAPGAMGGINPPSLAWLICNWTLIAIEKQSSEPSE